jgi:hypothetical protein
MAYFANDTPRTVPRDRTLAEIDDFSEMNSFAPPPGADNLLNIMANRGRKPNTLSTPSARNPLAQLRNPNAKPEFTPLLKSALKNGNRNRNLLTKDNPIRTPAALKPGYYFSSPHLPEASILGESEITTDDTPIPVPESSSVMSTPIPRLPRRGEMGMNGDGGNVLTLREQEAVSTKHAITHFC